MAGKSSDRAGAAPAPGEVAARAAETHADEVRATTGAAAVAAAAALAAGDGGPGAGAARVAEVVEGTVTRDMPIETARDVGLGERREAFPRQGELRAAEGLAFAPPAPASVVSVFDVAARAVTGAALRRGRDAILPLGGPTIDPATVPGRKTAIATTQLRRNGHTYLPGEPVSIDFRAHTELVPIGAIAATPWGELPDHDGD